MYLKKNYSNLTGYLVFYLATLLEGVCSPGSLLGPCGHGIPQVWVPRWV